MQLINSILLLGSALSTALSAVASPTDAVDWKYGVGWDGVTLPASEIGTPLATGNDTTLDKRNVGGVYICSDVNWGGKCGYTIQHTKTCIVLGSDWNKLISSFGPDPCTVCNAFESNDCDGSTGGQWQFVYPGDDFGGFRDTTPDGPWNDRLSSFQCFGETFC